MGEAVQGKRFVYLFRRLADAKTKTGMVMAFTTENTRTMSRDTDTTQTKDGAVNTPGGLENNLDCTALVKKDDDMAQVMEDALANADIIEVWEANLDDSAGDGNKYNGKYFQGTLTEWELSTNADDHAEYSTSIALNGAGVRGEVTVTAEQQAAAEYAFKDTSAEV